jgi:motility quorum-sensing regulator / GCU-specific mRNA interferase toxin
VEKRKPHYDLASIKATFATVDALRMTRTAHDCALALGLLLQDVVALIQEMTREQFYKSMTSKANVALWQDVYHVPWSSTVLYVKFTTDAEGYLVISLKEK